MYTLHISFPYQYGYGMAKELTNLWYELLLFQEGEIAF